MGLGPHWPINFYCTNLCNTDYAVARCPSVCLSVRLSHAGILSKLLNIKNKNLTIANRSRVSCAHYVEGIYDNSLTLKSRLTVTQGH